MADDPILRLAKARGEIYLAKSAENPFTKSGYVPLPDLHDAVMPVLEKYDIVPMETCDDGCLEITFYDVSDPKNARSFHSGSMKILETDDAQKNMGSLTYSRRYLFQTMIGVPAYDDDGNSAAGRQVPAAKKRASAIRKAKANVAATERMVNGGDSKRAGEESQPVRQRANDSGPSLAERCNKGLSKLGLAGGSADSYISSAIGKRHEGGVEALSADQQQVVLDKLLGDFATLTQPNS